MHGINVGRWLVGGLVATIVIVIVEVVGFRLYSADYQAAMVAHELAGRHRFGLLMRLSQLLLLGLSLVFVYVAARPRFGPGPKTAIIVAVAVWVPRYVCTALFYRTIGLLPDKVLFAWVSLGLLEAVLATLAGGSLYRESP
jgi:hypothetical protein